MTRVVIVAKVKDTAAWEKAFRGHADLFRSQPAPSPYRFGMSEDGEVAVCADVTDVDEYLSSLESAETIKAMENDGVKRDSVKVFVLDKEFSF
jgi:hypothetical protein